MIFAACSSSGHGAENAELVPAVVVVLIAPPSEGSPLRLSTTAKWTHRRVTLLKVGGYGVLDEHWSFRALHDAGATLC